MCAAPGKITFNYWFTPDFRGGPIGLRSFTKRDNSECVRLVKRLQKLAPQKAFHLKLVDRLRPAPYERCRSLKPLTCPIVL